MSEIGTDTKQQKEVAFYTANVEAWVNTKFEHDKSLLSLSAGAVGLLITLISTVGVKSSGALILYILSLACFVFCLGVILWVFKRNAKHLEDVIGEKEKEDRLLEALDRMAILSFMFGVILSSIIGVLTAFCSYKHEASGMTDKTKSQRTVLVQDSINGIAKMNPVASPQSVAETAKGGDKPVPFGEGRMEDYSLSGIARMKPVASPQPVSATAKGGDDKK